MPLGDERVIKEAGEEEKENGVLYGGGIYCALRTKTIASGAPQATLASSITITIVSSKASFFYLYIILQRHKIKPLLGHGSDID